MARSLLKDHHEAIRASDGDRERALDTLRDHWLAGRLTLDEYEERCDEVAAGRYLGDLRRAVRELPEPPPDAGTVAAPTQGSAILSIALGASSLVVAVATLGLFFLLTLPLSIWAWTLGRRARRRGRADTRALGTVGEVLGIVGTAVACTALVACAALISAL